MRRAIYLSADQQQAIGYRHGGRGLPRPNTPRCASCVSASADRASPRLRECARHLVRVMPGALCDSYQEAS